jgi:hypothetical protein
LKRRNAAAAAALLAIIAAMFWAAEEGRHTAPTPARQTPASLVTLMPPAGPRTLRFRLSAPAGHPLHLENCNGAFSWGLEHRVGDAWKPAWIVSTNACHSPRILIPPGESREFREAITLSMGESLPADTYKVAIYGLYREHDDRHASDSTMIPHALRVSEPFAFGPLAAPRRSDRRTSY